MDSSDIYSIAHGEIRTLTCVYNNFPNCLYTTDPPSDHRRRPVLRRSEIALDLPPEIPEEGGLSDVEEMPEESFAGRHFNAEELLSRTDVDALSEASFQSAIESQSRGPLDDSGDFGSAAAVKQHGDWQETTV